MFLLVKNRPKVKINKNVDTIKNFQKRNKENVEDYVEHLANNLNKGFVTNFCWFVDFETLNKKEISESAMLIIISHRRRMLKIKL